MGKLIRTYQGNPDDIKRRILVAAKQVADLKEQSTEDSGEMHIHLLVYNRYFLRNNSEASLSLLIISRPEETQLIAISAGGGAGILCLDLGAANKLTQLLEDALIQHGLR